MKPKKVRRVDTNKVPEMLEGETEETCKEHVKAMSKEMLKSTNRNVAMVKELMMITYAIRRKGVLIEQKVIPDVLQEYPALGLTSEVSLFK